ncbi:MAG: hypothetical protein SOU49_07005 [Sodaliphilus pleomorphus]|uniref:hypothetical protein n=1 Tax=Sodaliphilus pleomorphus TaxID=2606626 RepID=UPI002A74BEF8|nr:hypothetical protein [Sodaliphilus pleomorphus]MDY2832473.1 hypothetical protein [Sodaliphilus pleomorphus]
MIAKIAFILRLANFFDCKKGGWGGKKTFLAIFGRSPCLIFLVEKMGGKNKKNPGYRYLGLLN